MTNKDPNILNPLNSLIEKLEAITEHLIFMDLVAENVRQELPLTAKNSKKVRRIIRGGFTSPTNRNLRKLNALVHEVEGLIDFYGQYGGRITPHSLYHQLIESWKKEKARTARVYLGEIDRYLSFNQEGKIIKAIAEEKYDFITKENLKDLRDKIAGFMALINALKNNVEHLKSKYVYLGIDKTVF